MTFELFPAIDLRGGNVVRLRQGDYADETQYSDNPAVVARGFQDAGARWIHVVDLEAARDGGSPNLAAIEAICSAAPLCDVQTGGGVRSFADAESRFALGVARVIVGSAAVEHPEVVAEIAAARPGRVVVGLDVRGRELSTHGWTKGAGCDVGAMLQAFDGAGVGACVVTQINVDGLLTGADIGLYVELLAATAIPLVASGGVGSLDDLEALRTIKVNGRGLVGAIAGKAIYEGRFTTAQGVAACSRPE